MEGVFYTQHWHAEVFARLARQHFQRGNESQIFEVNRTQGTGQSPKIFNRSFCQVFQLCQGLATLLIFHRRLRELHTLFQGNHCLDGVIMQFAGQTGSLFLLS